MKRYNDRKRMIVIGKKHEVMNYLELFSNNDTTVLEWLNEQKEVKNQ